MGTLANGFLDRNFVNEEILRKELARALTNKPNEKYLGTLLEDDQAKRERKGVWG